MRRTLGTAVFAGMLGVTLFGIFLTPVFFYVIQWFIDLRGKGAVAAPVGHWASTNGEAAKGGEHAFAIALDAGVARLDHVSFACGVGVAQVVQVGVAQLQVAVADALQGAEHHVGAAAVDDHILAHQLLQHPRASAQGSRPAPDVLQ